MRPELVVICSGLLTFGVPLLFAVREILRTEPPDAGWHPDPPPTPEPQTPLGSPPARRRLPDCLIPRPAPAARVLEPVD